MLRFKLADAFFKQIFLKSMNSYNDASCEMKYLNMAPNSVPIGSTLEYSGTWYTLSDLISSQSDVTKSKSKQHQTTLKFVILTRLPRGTIPFSIICKYVAVAVRVTQK